MKTIIVIRHAKSSWANIGEKDFDRPLNERGKKEAVEMAEKLIAANVPVDAFVSSSAKRARKTAKAFVEEYGKTKEDIVQVPGLYNAPAEVFYETIYSLNNAYDSVALFAHNPGITDFVNSLCDDETINEMPTCGVFAVQTPITDWTQFKEASKQFLFFRHPKED